MPLHHEKPGHTSPESHVSRHVYKRVNHHLDALSVDLKQSKPVRDGNIGGFQDDEDEEREVGDEESPTDEVNCEESSEVRDERSSCF